MVKPITTLNTFLSAEQKVAVDAIGNVFLLARPGSGKTRTVAARLARLASEEESSRVATLSYTNVAVGQILMTVNALGASLGPQHYLGTLHQFLLDHVLYPFASLAPIEISKKIEVVVDSSWSGWPAVIFGGDPKKRVPVSEFHYQADGTFKLYRDPRIGLTREQAATAEVDQVRQKKKSARAMGVISATDALFYSLKLLREHSCIRTALAARYSEIIVDEAQDSSDLQIECLQLLFDTGELNSLVLVGDLDQSIYAFQGAQPQLCEKLASDCKLHRLSLTRNYRSSQRICDVTCRFCGRVEPDIAAGPNADNPIKPQLLLYSTAEPRSAVELFGARLSELGLVKNRAAVLVRAHKLRDYLNGHDSTVRVGRTVAAFARLASGREQARGISMQEIQAAEREMARLAWGEDVVPYTDARALPLRYAALALRERLPAFNGSVAEWIAAARKVVSAVLAQLEPSPLGKPGHVMRAMAIHKKLIAKSVFNDLQPPLWAHTVHSTKGESHEAVLLVVEPSTTIKNEQVDLWATPLRGENVSPDDAEELRIVYVALTRAERYCALALPDNLTDAAMKPYIDVGFVRDQ